MPYILDIWCDGACRNNGRHGVPVFGGWGVYAPMYPGGSIEQAGAILRNLDQGNTSATNNRAELQALVQALKFAQDAPRHLRYPNTVVVTNIKLDSRYTQGCVTEWRYKWERNGWVTNAGATVKDRDLIEEATRLMDAIRGAGDIVNIEKIDRSDNGPADKLANDGCDYAERMWS